MYGVKGTNPLFDHEHKCQRHECEGHRAKQCASCSRYNAKASLVEAFCVVRVVRRTCLFDYDEISQRLIEEEHRAQRCESCPTLQEIKIDSSISEFSGPLLECGQIPISLPGF